MFAYCENNPIMCSDPTGNIPSQFNNEWKNPRSIYKDHDESDHLLNGTFSAGIMGAYSPGIWSYFFQICLSTDMDGNTELQLTIGAALTSGDGPSFMPYVMLTNAPHVSKLRGFATGFGGTIPTKPAIDVDFNIIPDSNEGTVYKGITLGMGCGSGDVHVPMGNTFGWKLPINFLIILDNVYNSLTYCRQ